MKQEPKQKQKQGKEAEKEKGKKDRNGRENGNENENGKLDRAACLRLLCETQTRLTMKNERRYPRRSDFDEKEVVAIKAFLGPWPRALEAAGIKPPREDDRLERNREKRIRAKRNRRIAKITAGHEGDIVQDGNPGCGKESGNNDILP